MFKTFLPILFLFCVSCACWNKPAVEDPSSSIGVDSSLPADIVVPADKPLAVEFFSAATLVKLNPAKVPAKAVTVEVTCDSIYYGIYPVDDMIYLHTRASNERLRLDLVFVDIEGKNISSVMYFLPLEKRDGG